MFTNMKTKLKIGDIAQAAAPLRTGCDSEIQYKDTIYRAANISDKTIPLFAKVKVIAIMGDIHIVEEINSN